MPDTYVPFDQLLKEELPPLFRKLIPSYLENAYSQASSSAKKPLPELYRESLSDEQGLWAQCVLHGLAQGYSYSGVSASLVPNKTKRSHVEIETERVLVTCHRVPRPGGRPGIAEYRASNAALNRPMLPGLDSPLAPSKSKCNIYIIHGPDPDNPEQLGFVQLAVPDSGQKGYLAIKTLYASAACQTAKIEEIKDNVTLKLKAKEQIKNG